MRPYELVTTAFHKRIAAAALAATLLAGCQPRPADTPGGVSPTAAGHVTGQGQVVDAGGKPLAGATVTAYKPVQTYLQSGTTLHRLATRTTAADGRYSLRLPGGTEQALFVAEKEGLAIGWHFWSGRPGEPEGLIKLEKAAALSGKVVDEGGSPIRGATVGARLRPPRRGRTGWWLEGNEGIDSLVAKTGADGSFSFANIPASSATEFEVEAAGYAALSTGRSRRHSGYSPSDKGIKLTLSPEAKIEVTAVEKETGKPVGDVVLMATDYRGMGERLGRCISKQQGLYRWSSLPPGRYEISLAIPREGTPGWALAPVRVRAEVGRTATGTRLELARGGLVEVAVTEAGSGKPVRHCSAGLRNTENRWYIQGYGGEDGIVRLRLVPGEYQVRWLSAQGYARPKSEASVTVVAGQTSRVEVALAKLPGFHGVARDASGRPAPGTMICVLPAYRYERAGEGGKFEIPMNQRLWGHMSSFTLVGRDAERNFAAAVDVRDLAKPIDLKLLPAASLAGQVTDPGGKAIADADVSVLLGRADPQPLPSLARRATDAGGRFEVGALPPARSYAVRVRAEGSAVVDVDLARPAEQGDRVEVGRIVLRPVKRDAPAPAVREVPIPQTPGEWAIWGATGRDDRGHIWFAVTAHEVDVPSSYLFEYDPAADKVIGRGDVVSALKSCGVYRKGERQMKIHTKIIQASDGHLYFASMDEEGENEQTETLPTWGGHLWRLRRTEEGSYTWEHLLTVPEALIALAGGSKCIYTMGYFGHVLYQYDMATGKTRSVKVGAFGGHVSRNILADRHDHVYVPRIETGAGGGPVATLVEYDAELKEIAQTPLKYCFERSPASSHGITGLQALPDGSIVFVTHNGYLSRIQPSPDGPARVSDLGWFHPDGPNYAGSLFADSTGRCLMGAVRADWDQPYQWVVYDRMTRTHSVAAFEATGPRGLYLGRASLYGSQTRDDAGNCYVVGVNTRGEFRGESKPILLRVQPGAGPGGQAHEQAD